MSPSSAPPRPTAPAAGPPEAAPAAPRATGPSRWAADLLLGARFAVTGGWEGWVRTLLTAVGVGLGVTVLLLAASVPTVLDARDARERGRVTLPSPSGTEEEQQPPPSDTTALVHEADTTYHDRFIAGLVLQADGSRPPVPPGLREFPAPGTAVVSPALRDLLSSDEGELLRERLPYDIVGTIGNEGLLAPGELIYYAGTDQLVEGGDVSHRRITGFGGPVDVSGLDGVQTLLVVVGCVVLLLPVAVFLATAVRFGSERRDRRLAALRLVGADTHMTRRSAAGEALVGALFGLVFGGGLFLLLRQAAESVVLMRITAFPEDVWPDPVIAVFVLLSVPLAAVLVSLLAMRRIVVEPLGVVRRGVTRTRRLWWRLALPALGVLLLLPFLDTIGASDGDVAAFQIAAGMILVLFGVTSVLPWLLERVTGKLRGGPVPLQLAARRLQLDSEPAVRAVGGITIAVAGAIAVQMLFGSVTDRYVEISSFQEEEGRIAVYTFGTDTDRLSSVTEEFEAIDGVRDVLNLVQIEAEEKAADQEHLRQLAVTDCATVRKLLRVDGCRDGQVFLPEGVPSEADVPPLVPGTSLDLVSDKPDGPSRQAWKVPEDAVRATPDPQSWSRVAPPDVLLTPAAVDTSVERLTFRLSVTGDPEKGELLDHLRNTALALHPDSHVLDLGADVVDDDFDAIQRALYAGAVMVLLLIGASMIVSTLEQLRERRRLLSVLVAFGTRRSTLCWSVLWQIALPVVLGLALALVAGLGLGWLLLRMVGEEMAPDWMGILAMTGLGAALILLVTVLSLPTLWRMLRPDGLRTE